MECLIAAQITSYIEIFQLKVIVKFAKKMDIEERFGVIQISRFMFPMPAQLVKEFAVDNSF